jgi:hypothetical protein
MTDETWEPADVKMTDYWAEVIGGTYKPVKLGKHESSHPINVKRVLETVKGTEVADVIVGLIFWASIVRNREDMLIEELERLNTR